VTCLGPADATHFAVYLHGVDEPSVSEQELGNRQSLDTIARSLSMRIALPRASMPCANQPSSLCWGWAFDEREVDVATEAVKRAATSCFGAGHPFGLIGFSNGGYLVTKLLRTCELHDTLPEATWMLTVGSAMNHGPLEPRPEDLSRCGRLVMLVGTHDTYNFDPDDGLLHALEAKHADVSGVRFDGGHVVPEDPTRTALSELMGTH
jgi:predicted esterase